MNAFQKLDRNSRILLGIAVFGIILSIIVMLRMSTVTNQGSEGPKFASIISSTKDTRLKRAGSLSWSTVNGPVDCYEDDRIFTGNDSTATVEFISGGKVTLLPNSLISLSKGFVNLSSGSIEVDLQKGSIGIESFGERIELGQNSKYRLESDKNGRQVTKLAADGSEAGPTGPEQIISMFPEYGAEEPKFAGNIINLSWKSNYPDRLHKIEISPNGSFSVIRLTRTTNKGSVSIPASELPPSNVFWRILDSNGKILSRSSFFLVDDVTIDLSSPRRDMAFTKASGRAREVSFEWTKRINYPQRFQVAKDPEFAELLKNITVQSTQTSMSFTEEGAYYWRVGYDYGRRMTEWSKPSFFRITPESTITPLRITDLPAVLDYEHTNAFIAKVIDTNTCDEYQFLLRKSGAEVYNRMLKKPEYRINKLPDGDYTLTVRGYKKGKVLTSETTQAFVVKTTRQMKAPKIKTKQKVKLFVRVLKTVFDAIFPSAQAANATTELEWEPVEGATGYEVEISNAEGKVVVSHKTKKLNYLFKIPGPEQYYWRVRAEVDGKMSLFSGYSEIEVTDMVLQVAKPLMIFPGDQMKIRAKTNGAQVRFRWRVPSKSFSYVLEIFDRVSEDPVYTTTVSGGTVIIPAEELPTKFQWRVLAKSKFNNENPNPEKFTVELRHYEKKLPIYTIAGSASFLSSTLKNDLVDPKQPELTGQSKMSGPILGLGGEYFLDKKLTASVTADLRHLQLKDSLSSFQETRLSAEYGWLGDILRNVSHNIYLGGRISRGSLSIDNETNVSYMAAFMSARYTYIDHLSRNLVFRLDATLLMQVPDFGSPGYVLRPTLSYKANYKYWFDFFVLAEAVSTKFEASGLRMKDKATADQSNLGGGVGVTYRFGL